MRGTIHPIQRIAHRIKHIGDRIEPINSRFVFKKRRLLHLKAIHAPLIVILIVMICSIIGAIG